MRSALSVSRLVNSLKLVQSRLTGKRQAKILGMACALAREISRLARIVLVALLSIFAGCTISKKAQLPPLIRAERQLARDEKSRSDPQQEAAEILSIARI